MSSCVSLQEGIPELEMFNIFLRVRAFQRKWKGATLMLVYKGNTKPEITSSSYKPFCMFNNTVKLLKRLMLNRLNAALTT